MTDAPTLPYVRIVNEKTRLISDWLKDKGAFFNRSEAHKGWYLPSEHLQAALAKLDEVEFSPEEELKLQKAKEYAEELEKLGPLNELDHIELIPYNDVSFVLVGRTAPFDVELRKLKGRFFGRLKGFTFANRHYNTIVEWLEENDYGRGDVKKTQKSKKTTTTVKRVAPP